MSVMFMGCGDGYKYYYPLRHTAREDINLELLDNINIYAEVKFIEGKGIYTRVPLTKFRELFMGKSNFNDSDISNWDMSKATNLRAMFYKTKSFNQPLNNWDIRNVESMEQLFYGAEAFNQPLDRWKFNKKLTSFYGLFEGAKSFNQPLNNWDTSNITNMYCLFYKTPFNQPLNNWNTKNVTNMYSTFGFNEAFNQDISMWNVSNVTNHNGFDYVSNPAWTANKKPRFRN